MKFCLILVVALIVSLGSVQAGLDIGSLQAIMRCLSDNNMTMQDMATAGINNMPPEVTHCIMLALRLIDDNGNIDQAAVQRLAGQLGK